MQLKMFFAWEISSPTKSKKKKEKELQNYGKKGEVLEISICGGRKKKFFLFDRNDLLFFEDCTIHTGSPKVRLFPCCFQLFFGQRSLFNKEKTQQLLQSQSTGKQKKHVCLFSEQQLFFV